MWKWLFGGFIIEFIEDLPKETCPKSMDIKCVCISSYSGIWDRPNNKRLEILESRLKTISRAMNICYCNGQDSIVLTTHKDTIIQLREIVRKA